MPPQELDIAALDAQLEALLELEPAARQQRLAEIEAREPGLAAMLRKLLRVAAEVDTVELRGGVDGLQLSVDDGPPPPIPGYRLGSAIGRGGMATVYAAWRNVHGSEQPVAIKLLRVAPADSAERERFLTEQRILARLQHPHIARLIEVGSVGERPYMVLEQVDGQPVDRHWAPGTAPVATLLRAAIDIADALHHAHGHFIVHRDVKPENVLVDAGGQVRLIDFGIAKLLPAATLLGGARTATGAVPLTLRYASPEQLLGNPVGVASDVWQLGLLLYHLLTAAWPYDEAPGELPLQRLAHDQVPVPASRRVADARRRRQLQGDLDSILTRCLAWNPQDRYPSALAFREDLERHLQQRPVRARRHTRGYLLRCFVSRHRLGVVLGAAVLLLVAGAVAAALALAARSRDYAARTERILDSVATMFAHANPYAERPGEVTVAEVVRSTSERMLAQDDADPLFQVLMLERLAELQRALEDYRAEGALVERALALARTHALDGDIVARLEVQALESAFARGDLERVASAHARWRAGLDREHAVRADYVFAKVLIEQQRLAEAEVAFAPLLAALDQVEDPLFRHTVWNSHGILLRRLGRSDEAIAAYRRSLEFLDPDRLEHQEALLTVPGNIAIALGAAGRWAESDAEFSGLLRSTEQRLGAGHPQLASIARNYSTLLQRTGRYHSAAALLARYREASARSGDRIARASWLQAEANVALATGADEAALEAAIAATEAALAVHGESAGALAFAYELLALTLFELGHLAEAAAVAARVPALDASMAPRAATILAIAADFGVDRAPGVDARAHPGNECDQAERVALHAFLLERRARQQGAVPAACSATRAARLAALGWSWTPATPFEAESLDSPIARAARAGEPPPWPRALPAAARARVEAVLARLAAITRPAAR